MWVDGAYCVLGVSETVGFGFEFDFLFFFLLEWKISLVGAGWRNVWGGWGWMGLTAGIFQGSPVCSDLTTSQRYVQHIHRWLRTCIASLVSRDNPCLWELVLAVGGWYIP